MVARPGKKQSVFNAGEIGSGLDSRTELKYYNAGLAFARNIELIPQGGFKIADGLRHIGDTSATAAQLVPFKGNNGAVYDLAFNDDLIEVWGKSAKLYQFAHPYTPAQVKQFTWAQELDTLLAFHKDVAPWRALHQSSTSWDTGNAPLSEIPLYDYGATYSNGVAAVWELEFVGFDEAPAWDKITYRVSVNGQNTVGLKGVSTAPPNGLAPNLATMAANLQAALLQLPMIAPGLTVTVASGKLRITFAGDGNAGDSWAVSGEVVNKADAAVLANKTTVGKKGGEALISITRGWPRCGVFYQERLIMGGFKSLPGAWIASTSGNVYNFDTRLNTADGAFLTPLALPGGESIEALVNNQFLLVMTSDANYWVAGSSTGLSKTTPPKHVPASEHGMAAGVPVITNEGAALYITKSGDFLGEMRYTDVDGNYVAQDLSLLAYHLISNATDLAIRRKEDRQSANVAAVRNGDGSLRLVHLLREQELTGFTRRDTDGAFQSVCVNGRNEMTVIVNRKRGLATARTIERVQAGLLLDGAITKTLPGPAATIAGLGIHEGCEVWAIGDDDVYGPFCVKGGVITLPVTSCKVVTVGRWTPPRAETLPIPRTVGPDIWLQKKARIHSVQVMVEDATSLAIEVNGKVYDQPLQRFGKTEGVGELAQPFTGLVTARGFGGYVDAPQVTITQVRPGRLTVKSIVLEASL